MDWLFSLITPDELFFYATLASGIAYLIFAAMRRRARHARPIPRALRRWLNLAPKKFLWTRLAFLRTAIARRGFSHPKNSRGRLARFALKWLAGANSSIAIFRRIFALRLAVGRRRFSPSHRQILYWSRDAFFILLAFFILRAFIVEWFRIPSASMEPTLQSGDFVFVDKNDYGFRFPVLDWRMGGGRLPMRGEIVVFRYPPDEDLFYIKRIIGLPGEFVSYRGDRVFIDGIPLGQKIADSQFDDSRTLLWENIGDSGRHPIFLGSRESPSYGRRVPADHYFVLGDNRHHSSDSRVWGFVPRENLIGPAFRIGVSFSDWKRIGRSLALEEISEGEAESGDEKNE